MPDAGLQFHKEEDPLPQSACGEFSVAWGILIYVIRFVKANEKFPVLISEYLMQSATGCKST